jgi:hypothetical protein
MYQIITTIIGAVFLPIIWLYILKAPYKMFLWIGLKMQKPFSCGLCLSFWISFISLFLQTKFIDAIFISSAVPFIYLWMEDLITNKWELND